MDPRHICAAALLIGLPHLFDVSFIMLVPLVYSISQRSRQPLLLVGVPMAAGLMERLTPRVQALKIGPGTDPEADMGPLVTRQHLDKVRGYIDQGEREGATLVVDGRGFRMQGYEGGFFIGGTLFDHVTPEMTIYKEEIFGPVLAVTRVDDYESAARRRGARIRPPDPGRYGRHQCPDPGTDGLPLLWRLEGVTVWRPPHAWPRGGALLYEAEDDPLALADWHPQGGRLRDADNALIP